MHALISAPLHGGNQSLIPELFFLAVRGLEHSICHQHQHVSRSELHLAVAVCPVREEAQHAAVSRGKIDCSIGMSEERQAMSGVFVSEHTARAVENAVEQRHKTTRRNV